MSSKKGQSQETTYQNNMNASNVAAAAVSPEEQRLREYNNKLWDIQTGKTQFDVNNLPNSNVLMSLYKNAKGMRDANRIGKGLILGGNEGEGYKSGLAAQVNAQNEEERNLQAKGELEGRVADTFAGLEGKMMGLGQSDQNRRDNNFTRDNTIYNQYLNRPKTTPWWQTVLSGAAGIGASYLSGGLAGRK